MNGKSRNFWIWRNWRDKTILYKNKLELMRISSQIENFQNNVYVCLYMTIIYFIKNNGKIRIDYHFKSQKKKWRKFFKNHIQTSY